MLISVGDGSHEAIACEVAAKEFGIGHRNVNLLDTPSPKQMTQQLHLLVQLLPRVLLTAASPDDQQQRAQVKSNIIQATDFTAAVIVPDGRIEFQTASVNHCKNMSSAGASLPGSQSQEDLVAPPL